jgi:hypothetical protein
MNPLPIYPAVGTLASRALALLLNGNRITHHDFLRHAGTYRLSGYIHELREAGWPVITIEREKPTSDRKRRVAKVGEYHLPHDAIAVAAEKGRRFAESVQRWESGVVARTVGAARAAEMVNDGTLTDAESISEGAR